MRTKLIMLSTLLIVLMLPVAAHAQSPTDLIVLNDTTPAIDVVINPSPDTTGVVALEVNNASVTITDAVGNVVFETTTADIQALEFHFAPNAGTHTLTVERLPGATQAYSRIASLSEMNVAETAPNLVSGSTLAIAQEADYPLNANSPSATINFAISEADQFGTVTASFPGAPVTIQLVETTENRTMATLYGSLIDGVRFSVDTGTYELVLLNNNSERETVANVSILPASQSDFDTLVAQAETANTTTMTDTNTANTTPTDANTASTTTSTVTTTDAVACTMTIAQSSVNLRSGPGTGYSVLEYAFRGDELLVGGVNSESGWLLVGTETGAGWVSNSVGVLSGTCDTLTAYDTPYREASAPQFIIQQPQVPVYHDDDENEEHESHENESHFEREEHEEHEDDD